MAIVAASSAPIAVVRRVARDRRVDERERAADHQDPATWEGHRLIADHTPSASRIMVIDWSVRNGEGGPGRRGCVGALGGN